MVIKGSIVALVTPMNENGEININDLDKIVDFHLANGTNGLVLFGTTGEGYAIESDEKEQIVKRVISRVNGRIPIIMGTGHNCTKQAITETRHAEKLGADAALIVTPYYNKPTQNGLIAHYKAISNNVKLPIILYNVPGRTACDMQPETVAVLAEEPNIIGLKEAVANLERIKKLVSLCPKDFSLLSGDDETFLEFCRQGGHGVISVTSNVFPKQMAEIYNLAVSDRWNEAAVLNSMLDLTHKNLFLASNPMPVKWALYYLGLISSPACRLPLLPLEQQHQEQVINALKVAMAGDR